MSDEHDNDDPDRAMRALLRPEALDALRHWGIRLTIEAHSSDGEDATRRFAETVEALHGSGTSLERLQQMAAIGELGAGVSHETRNLLTAILSFSQVGQRKPEKASLMLERIEREARRCVELLAKYLSFVRDAEHAADASDADPAAVVDEVVSLISTQLKLHRIQLAQDLEPDLPAVAMRHGELVQVLLNLLVNAMHATPQGGAITIESRRQDESTIAIVVADTGPGISSAERDRVFESYFTTKPPGEGTGLGLAISKRLVTRSGGTLTIDDDVPEGASLRVRLPVVQEG